MKRTLLSLILALFAVVGINARTFVLITGITDYPGKVNDLRFSTKDAKEFKSLMSKQTNDIVLLTSSNVTKPKVLDYYKKMCNAAKRGDRIIFYFSGHGVTNGMALYDVIMPYADLIALAAQSEASEKVFYLDTCLSGSILDAVKGYDWSKSKRGKNDLIIFASSRPDENSRENKYTGQSLFTQALLKGLRGKADTDGNKKIDVTELFKYIYQDVMSHSDNKIHPQLIAPQELQQSVLYVW